MVRVVVMIAGVSLAASPLAGQGTRLDSIQPYLMDRTEEIALARSAAPFDLGRDASVWILTRDGYVEAAHGSNGFACFVGRGWSGPILIGPPDARRLHPDVFDRQLRAPHCFNPQAVRSVLPWHLARTRYLLDGVPAENVDARTRADVEAGRLHLPEPGAMAYMMLRTSARGSGRGGPTSWCMSRTWATLIGGSRGSPMISPSWPRQARRGRWR